MKYATMPTVLILLLVLKVTAFPGLSLWIVTAPLWVPIILVLLILILEAFIK